MYIPIHLRQSAKKYALGKYVIHPAHINNAALEQWIKNIQYEQYEIPSTRMQLHSRKRNNLYTFHLAALDKQVVLKVSQISKQYKWYRKLNLILVGLFKNYSLNAYYGGIALEKINVDSIKVIAHWTCKRQTENEKSYLLYEKVDASMSVFDLCQKISEVNPRADEIISAIAQALAKVIRVLHSNNIRHGDPHAGNFLLCSPISDFDKLTTESVEQMKFSLIDLDKMHYSDHEKAWRKKINDLRCIRRFFVHNIDNTKCLEYYLERKPKLSERMILKFWMRGGFNIYKWLKPNKKRN